MEKYRGIIQQINYGMFLVLIASLPFPRTIIQWVWIVWALTWLLELRFLTPSNIQWGKRMIPSLFLLGWVLWECLSMLWGQGPDGTFSFPVHHVSLLVFPLVMLYGLNELYDWKQIARVFIVASVASFFIYCWLLYWVTNGSYLFSNGHEALVPFQLSYFDTVLSPIKHRMLYCSVMGLAVILLFFIRKDLIAQRGKWMGYIEFFGAGAILMTAILATGSRANLLSLVAVGAVALICQIKRHKALIASIIAVLGIVCCLVIWQIHPRMKNLTLDQVVNVEDHYQDSDNEPRVVIWHLALQSPEDYLAKGIGVGNVKAYMAEKYIQNQFHRYASEQYGVHDQYLSICMELGLLAMLIFIFMWYAIPCSFPKKSTARMMAFYFVLFFGLNMLTDDNLSRFEGVVYTCVMLMIMDIISRTENCTSLSNS